MIENYLNYRDIVFINRRFSKTRFSKTLIMFCGINNHGKNIIFAICILTKDDQDGYDYMLWNLDKAFSQQPKLFVVEKCSPLKNSIQKFYPGVKVLYCYTHYQRCIRHYFENAKPSQKKYLEKGSAYLDPLPLLDEQKEFDSKMSYLRANQQDLANGGEKLFQLIEKICNEKGFWSRCVHQGHFTGQVNFCERTESIKVRINDYFGEKRMTVDEITRFISKSDGLQSRLE